MQLERLSKLFSCRANSEYKSDAINRQLPARPMFSDVQRANTVTISERLPLPAFNSLER